MRHLQDSSQGKYPAFIRFYLLLRATRGAVTEMHGHARIMIRLSVMLLSSRENHFLILITCEIRPLWSTDFANCLTLSGRNLWIWESVIAHTLVGQVGDCWSQVSSTVSATTILNLLQDHEGILCILINWLTYTGNGWLTRSLTLLSYRWRWSVGPYQSQL